MKPIRRAFNLLNQNCRLAARLLSDAQERPLGPLERTGLAIHLAGCANCRRYRRQIQTIENLLRKSDHASQNVRALSDEARHRITMRLEQGE